MKETRFRAWHIKEKKMYQPIYLHFAPDGKLFGILVVDWHDSRYPVHTIGPVKWDDEYARWDVGEGGWPQVDAQYHFEVIGNVYENPELAIQEEEVTEV